MPNANRRLAAVAVTSACLLALTACGSPTDPDALATDAASAAASPSASAPAAQVGECFDIGTSYSAIANRWVIDSPAIPCTPGTYTLQTVAVYDVPADLSVTIPELDQAQQEVDNLVDGATAPRDLQDLLDEASTALRSSFDRCEQDFLALIDRRTVDAMTRTDMLFTYLTGPDEREWADGARWLRCGVIMPLSPDSTRAEYTLLPLPADLANAANILATQLCSHGEGTRLVVLPCDSPDMPDDAWLTLSLGTPMSALGAFPGKDEAYYVLADRCTSFATNFVKSDAELTEANTLSKVYLPSGEDVSDWSPKRMWNDPDMLIQCGVRKHLFADAP